MGKVYRDEITTKSGHEVEVQVTENHPSYSLNIENGETDCHWTQEFSFEPVRRSPGDSEIFANALMRLGRRWAVLYCP